MLAQDIYSVLNRYRKNPYQLVYDGSLIIHKIDEMIQNRLPITMVFPGCHGKINHVDMVIDHMPDLAEFLGIESFSNLCLEIQTLYPGGVKLLMVHEGHFYSDTPLIQSDATMDE